MPLIKLLQNKHHILIGKRQDHVDQLQHRRPHRAAGEVSLLPPLHRPLDQGQTALDQGPQVPQGRAGLCLLGRAQDPVQESRPPDRRL